MKRLLLTLAIVILAASACSSAPAPTPTKSVIKQVVQEQQPITQKEPGVSQTITETPRPAPTQAQPQTSSQPNTVSVPKTTPSPTPPPIPTSIPKQAATATKTPAPPKITAAPTPTPKVVQTQSFANMVKFTKDSLNDLLKGSWELIPMGSDSCRLPTEVEFLAGKVLGPGMMIDATYQYLDPERFQILMGPFVLTFRLAAASKDILTLSEDETTKLPNSSRQLCVYRSMPQQALSSSFVKFSNQQSLTNLLKGKWQLILQESPKCTIGNSVEFLEGTKMLASGQVVDMSYKYLDRERFQIAAGGLGGSFIFTFSISNTSVGIKLTEVVAPVIGSQLQTCSYKRIN